MTVRALTARQWDVLHGASHGETAAVTAKRLGISRETVRDHRTEALRRLRARTMAQAVAVAIQEGVLP